MNIATFLFQSGDTPLNAAARRGHLNIVKFLLERADIDPNKENRITGNTPLHTAACYGFINIVELLLKREDVDPKIENKVNGGTLLHSAVSGEDLDIVQLLLEKADIDPNKENESGDTPLNAAARHGHLNIVKFLLERADIDPNKENRITGDTPLHTAACYGFISIVELLLKREDIDQKIENKVNGGTLLHSAVSGEDLDIVQLLLEKADIDPNKENESGDTPLNAAARHGHLNIITGDTPLHTAASYGFINIVELLLERGDINPNIENKITGNTPLHRAACYGFINIVELLLKREDIDPKIENKVNGGTLLHSAVSGEDLDIVQLLLEKADIDPNKENEDGNTAFDLAAEEDQFILCKLLLDKTSIDPLRLYKDGNTVLHKAVKCRELKMVEMLLKLSVIDPNQENESGETPLNAAARRGHLNIVKLLLERSDIDPNKENRITGNTPLHTAVSYGFINIVKLLLEKADIDPNIKNKITGNTPLHTAACYGFINIVGLLLQREDIDPNIENKDGNTAFDLAAEEDQFILCKLLLDKTSIDPLRLYKDGNTVLHKAVKSSELEMVEMLLKLSVIDPNRKNEDGNTAFDLAAEADQFILCKLLLDKTSINPLRLYQDGNSVLHKAVKSSELELVEMLLKLSVIDPNRENEDWNTAFDLAAEENQFILCKLLLDTTSIDPLRLYKDGNTVLHKAVYSGELEMVEMLLKLSVIDPNRENEFTGDTPLYAAAREREDIDPNIENKDGDTAFDLAAEEDRFKLCKLLLDKTNIDPLRLYKDGNTVLHKAVRRGELEMVELLLMLPELSKIDPNQKNKNGDSILQSAIFGKNPEMVKLILARTVVDPTEKNTYGDTALHSGARRGNLEIVKLLLERTAMDPTEKNQQGNTPYDVVENYWIDSEEKTDAKEVIQSYMTKQRSVHKNTTTVLEQDDSPQETFENEAVNQDLLPFAGTSEDFHILLSTGTYESYDNRVFLCGSCACGKSTLASVLIGSPIPLTWNSTDGLVIHFGRNGINLETYEMVPLKEEDRGHNVMTKLIIGKPNREIIIGESADTKQELCIAPSSTDHSVSHLQVTKENTGFSSNASVSPEAYIRQVKHLQDEKITTPGMKKVKSISLPQFKKVEAYAVHGDILKEVKSGQYKIKIAPSDLVDFGGQRSYDMTHQLFIQHGGTFVVMFDGSKDFQEPLTEYPTGDISNETIVKHWVNSILTYCVDDNDVMPKIVFAATHRDLLSDDMQNKMNMKFVKKISEMFGSHEMKKHIVFEPVFFINGTDKDDHDIQNLTNQLVTIARNQPSWGQRRPMLWVPLELLIANMIKDNVHIVPKTQLAEANTMNKDLALSERQLEDFLLTQHSLGKIMYFNQPELNNFIILYPPTLVNILRSFITDEIFWPKNETLKGILRRMRKLENYIKETSLHYGNRNNLFIYMHDDDSKEFIIQVLVHLDVLVLPKQYTDNSDTHVDYFLVPCTVKQQMPMFFLDDKSFANRTIALVYQIQKSSIPSALSFKLVGAVSSIWPIKEVDGRPLLYHSAAVLCVDSNTEFRIMVEETRVVVYLTNMSSRSYISPDIAASIQECLTTTLQAVLKFYFISIGKNQKKAKQTTYWVCESGNKHSSRIALLWFFNKTQEECPSHCPGKLI
ncbi:unnamed protein product [Mytilus coruscus]|uniref:Uncharacterized protein n=1 Tax=Mytilus coruscus TaxID=42192 RepID=A0A6J8BWZ9_MYTCO|nr:unnamed protein product [Mytilus coruscus]